MNKILLAAAALSAATALLHVFGGGPEVHEPLLESGLSGLLAAFTSVLWHFVTVIVLANSAALCVAAIREDSRNALVVMVSGQYLAFAALFLIYGLMQLDSVMLMPQWLLFVAISGLAIAGMTRPGSGRNPVENHP